MQIDESLFKHKVKYNRGMRASKEQWVFGMADTSHKPAITYMQVVDDRKPETVLPIIRELQIQTASSTQTNGEPTAE